MSLHSEDAGLVEGPASLPHVVACNAEGNPACASIGPVTVVPDRELQCADSERRSALPSPVEPDDDQTTAQPAATGDTLGWYIAIFADAAGSIVTADPRPASAGAVGRDTVEKPRGRGCVILRASDPSGIIPRLERAARAALGFTPHVRGVIIVQLLGQHDADNAHHIQDASFLELGGEPEPLLDRPSKRDEETDGPSAAWPWPQEVTDALSAGTISISIDRAQPSAPQSVEALAETVIPARLEFHRAPLAGRIMTPGLSTGRHQEAIKSLQAFYEHLVSSSLLDLRAGLSLDETGSGDEGHSGSKINDQFFSTRLTEHSQPKGAEKGDALLSEGWADGRGKPLFNVPFK